MTIDYQVLREAAEQATQDEWVAYILPGHNGIYPARTSEGRHCGYFIDWPGIDGQRNAGANARYIAAIPPKVALSLLDERERNQQYIKSRDQENEDIALTVGKLRVELEAEKQRAKDLFMENARLKSGIAGLIHLGIRYADVEVMKIAGDAQLSTPCTDSIINSIATGIRIKGE
ncbi:ead/Ea22-like family protein [Escherichia coli]|nr:ead/Ea22-like family protein [Escherichia coli]